MDTTSPTAPDSASTTSQLTRGLGPRRARRRAPAAPAAVLERRLLQAQRKGGSRGDQGALQLGGRRFFVAAELGERAWFTTVPPT